MKHKKEFFGVLISVLVSVFLVFLFVYATTVGSDITVDDDMTVTDDLIVTGLASVSEDLWVDRIYGTLGNGYLSIGDAGTTGHGLVAEDDLLVTGKLEVDGTAYFDGSVSISNAVILSGGEILYDSSGGDFAFQGGESGDTYNAISFSAAAGKSGAVEAYADGADGASPYIGLYAYYGANTAIYSDVAIDIQTNTDDSDYLRFQTTSNVPEILTVGSADLKIRPDGGDLYLDATVSVSDGFRVDGTAWFDGFASMSGAEGSIAGYYEIIRLDKVNNYIYFNSGPRPALWLMSEINEDVWLNLSADTGIDGSGDWEPDLSLYTDHDDDEAGILSYRPIRLQTGYYGGTVDLDDFIVFQTQSNVPEIITSGSCDLKMRPDGGDLYLDATVSVSDSLRVAGTATFGGLVSVSNSGILVGDGGPKIFGGDASPQGSTLNCPVGSIYLHTDATSADDAIARCEAVNSWDYLDLADK